MNHMAKALILCGVALIVVGGLILAMQRLGLGRLPGDLTWRGKHGTVHFPLATSLIVSLILTLLLNLWLRRRL
jgi:hypothetical protein